MKKTVLVYGLISGAIVTLIILVGWVFMNSTNGNMDVARGKLVNYTTQVLAMSFIFIAVHTYKKNILGGSIKFWQSLKIGLLISLIASTCYVIAWVMVFHYGGGEEFMDRYMASMMKNMSEEKRKGAEDMVKFYKTWPGLISWTYVEILPTGIIMSLISAIVFSLIGRKKKDNTATA